MADTTLAPPRPPPLRNEKGQLLPGQVLNPGGRPRALERLVRETVGEHGVVEVVTFLQAVVRNPGAKVADRIAAARVLLERVLGAPKQTVEVDGVNAPAIALAGYSTEQLMQMRSILDAPAGQQTSAPRPATEKP